MVLDEMTTIWFQLLCFLFGLCSLDTFRDEIDYDEPRLNLNITKKKEKGSREIPTAQLLNGWSLFSDTVSIYMSFNPVYFVFGFFIILFHLNSFL